VQFKLWQVEPLPTRNAKNWETNIRLGENIDCQSIQRCRHQMPAMMSTSSDETSSGCLSPALWCRSSCSDLAECSANPHNCFQHHASVKLTGLQHSSLSVIIYIMTKSCTRLHTERCCIKMDYKNVHIPSLPCGNYSLLWPLQSATAASVPATPTYPAQSYKKCCLIIAAHHSHTKHPHILYSWVVRYWHSCVCSQVQMICIWSSWCHCHPIISYSSKI